MSDADNRHPQHPHPDQGWQPLPQGGEYESEATAFVQLPEGFTAEVYGGRTPGWTPGADPLAAPGHGYTPPASFTPHTAHAPHPPQAPHAAPPAGAGGDPAATGQWTMPFADPSAGYADPSAGYPTHGEAHPHHAPHAPSEPYQGGAPEAARPWGGEPVQWPVAGSPEAGATGSWSIPAADDGLEESGEYLLGDERLTGHPGGTGGYGGQHGYTGPDAAAYQGGPYQDSGGYDGADADGTGGAGATGHWNFTAGLSATAGTQQPSGPTPQTAPGGPAQDPYGAPAEPSYPHDHGLGEVGAAGHGAGPAHGDHHHERHGDHHGDRHGDHHGDPHGATGGYGTDTGAVDAAAGATGHWSLPADALAQWPPAPTTEQPQHDGATAADRHDAATEVPAPAGAGSWSTPAGDERPEEPGAFASADEGHPAEPHAADADAAPNAPAPGGPSAEPAGYPAAESAPAEAAEPTGPDGSDGAADPGAPEESAAPVDPAEQAGPAEPDDPAEAVAADAGTDPAGGSEAPAEAPADAGPEAAEAPAPTGLEGHDEHPATSYVLRVNGIDRPVTDAWIGESLLYVLRERLGLAGAKDGCSQGECGACSVQVDGRLVASCLVPAATTAGCEVRTVEGLAQHGVPSDVQRALAASGAVQCGFCVPGMAMTVHDLLEGNHAPSELEVRKALCGNLCRCSGYQGVVEAVEEVVKAREQAAEAAYATEDAPDAAAPADTARIPHQAGPADPMGHAPHDQDPQTGGSA
ncbi:2Fe-2S iron-sulfur cluster-binding protein [Streptomyces sp. NPDC020742]|uniref:2Fe-2S iron-sulfur cluster-binding protein n=1 Tax=Streptomyces sp. NPDC020742 TaxID=3154897 RepID=UPI0033D18D7B